MPPSLAPQRIRENDPDAGERFGKHSIRIRLASQMDPVDASTVRSALDRSHAACQLVRLQVHVPLNGSQ